MRRECSSAGQAAQGGRGVALAAVTVGVEGGRVLWGW